MADPYRINITQDALGDLVSIFDHISAHSPQNAATMIGRILDAIDSLEFLPGRARVVGRSRVRQSAIHARVVRPFVIYYRVDEGIKSVFILEIRHGARRQPRTFT